MSHFAEVINGIVTRVIVVDQETIDLGIVGDPANWIQTSYNTAGGQHKLNGTPLRKNYASPGYTYDSTRDAFIPPKPYDSWFLDEETCLWNPPVPKPLEGKYLWDEGNTVWVLAITKEETAAPNLTEYPTPTIPLHAEVEVNLNPVGINGVVKPI
jgi:hypothetical protein